MSSKIKVSLENQKQVEEKALAACVASLTEKGVDDQAIRRNALVRKLQANIRTAKARLGRLAKQEKLNAQRAQEKADKLQGKGNGAAKEKGASEQAKEAKPQKPAKEKKAKHAAPPPESDAPADAAPAADDAAKE